MSNLALGGASPESPELVNGWNSSRSSARVGIVGALRSRMVQTGLVALALVTAGCSGAVVDRGVGPRDGGGTVNPSDRDAGTRDPADPAPSCGESTLEVQQLLSNACVRCHGEVGSGGLANIDNVDALIAAGRVVPGDAAGSPLYRRISAGTMPPTGVTPRPTDTQILAVETWINCGAPAFDPGPGPVRPTEAVKIDDVMDLIADDLRRLDNRAQRTSLRYIVLTHRANAGATPGELSQLRDAVDVLINHLSTAPRVQSPVAIDRERTILRIDIEDYGWDASTWDEIVSRYPYFVQYDDTSIEFPFDASTQEFIQQETREEIPFIFADWFVANASQPPLYYDILELPNTVQALYAQLGVDFEDDLRNFDFVRAGFAVSGVSVSNRIMQRNRSLDGYTWSSFDFASSSGAGNIFDHPTDFQEDGGEVIFSLPNGLQGYFVNNAAGRRLDVAPVQVVSDPSSPTREVIPGRSCMGCHDAAGPIARSDELRAHVIATSPSGAERNQVLNTHPSNTVLSEIFARDSEAYQAARRLIGRDGRERPVPDSAVTYLEVDRSLRDLAALLWLDADRVRDAILTDTSLSRAFRALATSSGGRISREELEDELANIVCSIGVGRPVCTDLTQQAPCGCIDPR